MGPQPGGDGPELGCGTGRDDDPATAAGVDHRPHQCTPGQLCERCSRIRRPGGLRHRQRLAGQRRLVGLQAGHGDEPDVGWDDVAQVQVDDVARHQRGDVHRGGPAVAGDHGRVGDLGVQGLGGLLGPVLVDEPQADGESDDHRDDDRAAAFPDEERDRRGADEQAEQRGAQLVPEHRQEPRPVGGHRVRPVPGESAPGLGGRQPGRGGDGQVGQDAGDRTGRRHDDGRPRGTGAGCGRRGTTGGSGRRERGHRDPLTRAARPRR